MEEQFAERVPACREGRRFDPDQVHQLFSNCLCKWKSSLRSASRLAGKVVGSIPTRSTKYSRSLASAARICSSHSAIYLLDALCLWKERSCLDFLQGSFIGFCWLLCSLFAQQPQTPLTFTVQHSFKPRRANIKN